MKRLFQFAAGCAIATAACVHAQIVSPEVLIPRAPSPPEARSQAKATEDLQWLWAYATPAPQGDKAGLLADGRFMTLLQEKLRAPQAMWGTGVPLSEAAEIFLGGDGNVASSDGRHLTATGCVVEHCPQRGLFWVDLAERNPLLVFAALRWNEQGHTTEEANATFTLWIFPSRVLDAHQLPVALKQSLARWAGKACAPSNITSAIVVDPNGIPHIVGTLDAFAPEVCRTKSGTHL